MLDAHLAVIWPLLPAPDATAFQVPEPFKLGMLGTQPRAMVLLLSPRYCLLHRLLFRRNLLLLLTLDAMSFKNMPEPLQLGVLAAHRAVIVAGPTLYRLLPRWAFRQLLTSPKLPLIFSLTLNALTAPIFRMLGAYQEIAPDAATS